MNIELQSQEMNLRAMQNEIYILNVHFLLKTKPNELPWHALNLSFGFQSAILIAFFKKFNNFELLRCVTRQQKLCDSNFVLPL